MVKKTTRTAQKKTSGFSAEINKLEACVNADCARLEKAYPKALSSVEKELKRLSKELQKVKASNKPAKKGKAASKSKVKAKPIDTSALVKQIDELKAEKATLQSGHKKMTAGKKMWQKIEKSFAKKPKKKSTSAKKAKRKVAAPSLTESVQKLFS